MIHEMIIHQTNLIRFKWCCRLFYPNIRIFFIHIAKQFYLFRSGMNPVFSGIIFRYCNILNIITINGKTVFLSKEKIICAVLALGKCPLL